MSSSCAATAGSASWWIRHHTSASVSAVTPTCTSTSDTTARAGPSSSTTVKVASAKSGHTQAESGGTKAETTSAPTGWPAGHGCRFARLADDHSCRWFSRPGDSSASTGHPRASAATYQDAGFRSRVRRAGAAGAALSRDIGAGSRGSVRRRRAA